MADAAAAATPALAALGAQKAYGARPPAKAADKLDAVAQDFEAVYLTQMMEQMFSGLGDGGPLGSGEAGSAYRSMLADQYGKTIAASGGIGLADDVRRELIAIQQGGQSS
ncbi:rod-binding protein [Hansschlegelia sp.]|uniref:rod-binding protein n=1 Tax=Hansschlegelia sp. TaxID=2041892 RepID=UPI002C1EC25D|nr:rod-binding protein [Hansschlegelia sp.]HVI30325.1 rod-binding protein [Hansschlegelia sp.]